MWSCFIKFWSTNSHLQFLKCIASTKHMDINYRAPILSWFQKFLQWGVMELGPILPSFLRPFSWFRIDPVEIPHPSLAVVPTTKTTTIYHVAQRSTKGHLRHSWWYPGHRNVIHSCYSTPSFHMYITKVNKHSVWRRSSDMMLIVFILELRCEIFCSPSQHSWQLLVTEVCALLSSTHTGSHATSGRQFISTFKFVQRHFINV
jgi:hypothetical protein